MMASIFGGILAVPKDSRMYDLTDDKGPMMLFGANDCVIGNDGRVLGLEVEKVTDEISNVFVSVVGTVVHNAEEGTFCKLAADGAKEVLVQGLPQNEKAIFCNHRGSTYWKCGDMNGIIYADGTIGDWIVKPPAVEVSAIVVGALPKGQYHIAVVPVDDKGNEGAPEVYPVLLKEPGGIKVERTDSSNRTAYIYMTALWNSSYLYAGTLNGSDFMIYEPASGPYMRNAGLSWMPIGDGMESWNGFLLTWQNRVLLYSEGWTGALTQLGKNLFVFPEDIIGVVGIQGGIWVVTATNAYFVNGANPKAAGVMRVCNKKFAVGGARIGGFSASGETGFMAAFVCEDGLALGMQNGKMDFPTSGKIKLDTEGKKGSITEAKIRDQDFVVVSLQ